MDGWHVKGARERGGSGFVSLREAYLACDPKFTGRVSVPVLWDKTKRMIVNNESLDIIRILNDEFATLSAAARFDLYPIPLQTKIDMLNDRTNRFLAAGVYDVAAAENQAAYDSTTGNCSVSWTNSNLCFPRVGPFLFGNTITIADVLVFPALVRYDSVYAPLFRIGGKRLSNFAALSEFVRQVHEFPGIGETVRFDHILAHYFDSDWSILPRRGIVPNLTEMSWYRPSGC